MDTGTEAFKSTVERASVAGNQAFKDGVEKSLGMLNEVNSLSKGNIEAVIESMTAATKGVETVGAQTAAFAKKNWEDAVAAGKSLSTAKSVQEVIELQSSWAKSSIEAYVSEMNTISETLSASFKDTFKPINARMTAAVEKFQSYK
ncbi:MULTISPECIES: phasin family protein [Asticcacaulis]|uniref:TIGR01841 family phasin n=1 Tax=Asticcacaulis machinosus TaxID=2984211 RepID=A0ABT5HHG7_9CAUL|nr:MULTISPECIES: TIGR01841 family phasin [Asticcacaulis]MDC7675692.1 TIGR01841 family phasin [Asticcacaulis machinosus]WAC49368.1 TIGR01841 family phasin [Asticcacaulis sp. SL142]